MRVKITAFKQEPTATLRELWPQIKGALPAWVLAERASDLRRILDGHPGTKNHPPFEGLGDVPLADITARKLQELTAGVQARVGDEVVRARRHNGTPLTSWQPADNGLGAARNLVEALRAVFKVVHEDLRLVPINPARDLMAPPKNMNARQSVARYLAPVHTYIDRHRRDPDLDHRLLDCVIRTAYRREGLLDLRVGYLDPLACVARSPQKNHTVPRVPVARSVLLDWRDFAAQRGSTRPDNHVFCRRGGAPVTSRYIDGFVRELQQARAWGSDQPVSLHWLRTTTLDAIAGKWGILAAKSWAGHSLSSLGAIGHYVEPLTHEQLRVIAEDLFGTLEDIDMPDYHP